jgi:hypothetical protein
MAVSMEERLKRRKLDALKRGVHRATGGEATPIATHLVGIGKAGAAVIAEALRNLQPGGPRLNALVVDIGENDLAEVRALADDLPADRAAVTVVSLDVPDRDDLLAALETYPEYLSLEYPRHRSNPHYQPWLDASAPLPKAGGHFSRAVAKAIYGQAYYGAPRVLHEALVAFAAAVDAVPSHAMVAVIFGMGGGTGSGIVVDLVRHLSNRCFGRRVLMAGIGIAPCDGDASDHRGPGLYPLLNELDTMGDEDKNAGVVQSCGELFRNPFTAGFIIVPQQQAWLATHGLAETHRRGNREIASLLTASGGTHLWELLRLLNWVAAPSTQHSAARTPWGARWIHMFGYADAAGGGVAIGDDLLQRLGLLPGYNPEFVELRVASLADADVAAVTAGLQQALRARRAANGGGGRTAGLGSVRSSLHQQGIAAGTHRLAPGLRIPGPGAQAPRPLAAAGTGHPAERAIDTHRWHGGRQPLGRRCVDRGADGGPAGRGPAVRAATRTPGGLMALIAGQRHAT